MTAQAIKPVECIVTSGTAKTIQAAFDLAVKNGKSSYLGSVGGDTAQSDQTKRVVGQVQLFWRKDKSFHAVGKNGYDVVVKASGAQDAIMKTRKLLKTDKELSAQAYDVGKNCVKFAPISKVGRQIDIIAAPEFFKLYDGDKTFYIAFYKTSDKWAVGIENGRAVTIGAKLSDSIWNRNKMAQNLLNVDVNILQRAGKAFFARNIKRYTEQDVADVTGKPAKAVTPKAAPNKAPAPTAAKPPFIAKPSAYVKVAAADLVILNENYKVGQDKSGNERAVKLYSYKDGFAVATETGYVVLKTKSSNPNVDDSLRHEIIENAKRQKIHIGFAI
jgi:hypothetical protein